MLHQELPRLLDLVVDSQLAVESIRTLILGRAMRGLLVPQDPSEGSGGDVARAIASTSHSSKDADGGSTGWHDVPPSWTWEPLGTVGRIAGGGTPRSDNHEYFGTIGIPWLTPADLNGVSAKYVVGGRRCITEAGLANSSARMLPAGTVLFSSRAPIGYVAIAQCRLATNQGFKSCIPHLPEMAEFLYYYLRSAAARVDSEAPGTTFKEVSGRIVSRIPVPIPPLAEQERIVAKVDELMALCDRLEAQLQERDARSADLAKAALAQFSEEPSVENLEYLFHPSFLTSANSLRKTILQLATRGKLVPQQAPDGTAATSFPALASARLEAMDAAEPTQWLCVPLGCCGDWLGGGTPSKNRPDYWSGELPWVSPKDMKVPRIFDSQDHISRVAVAGSSVRLIPAGSVMMVVRGMILARAFPVALSMREVTINQDMKALVPHYPSCAEFLLLALRAMEDQVLGMVERSSHGTCKLKTDGLLQLPISIPPLAEQRRIVSKVDELMKLVDQLESQLAASEEAGTRLLDALVAELTPSN